MSSALLNTILPLVGVTLGVAGTFTGQYLATHETKEQAKAAALAARREELKEIVLQFLEICQRVERTAEHRWQNENKFVEGSPDLTHEMWFRQKCIDIVGSPRIREAAWVYATQLSNATYGHIDDGQDVWNFLTSKRQPFLDAARAELGIPELPLP